MMADPQPVAGVLDDADTRMEIAVDHFIEKTHGLSAGRASPYLVENVLVDCYGLQTPLKHPASVGTRPPRLVVVKPFDSSTVPAVMRALQGANLGSNPQSDGQMIRLPIPALSAERRQELVRAAKAIAEEQRVAVRNVRRSSNRELDKLQKDGTAEDLIKPAKDQLDSATKLHLANLESALEGKTKQLLED